MQPRGNMYKANRNGAQHRTLRYSTTKKQWQTCICKHPAFCAIKTNVHIHAVDDVAVFPWHANWKLIVARVQEQMSGIDGQTNKSKKLDWEPLFHNWFSISITTYVLVQELVCTLCEAYMKTYEDLKFNLKTPFSTTATQSLTVSLEYTEPSMSLGV